MGTQRMRDIPTTPQAISQKSLFRRRLAALWAILLVMGPGIITSNVDNDAGGIATYSLAGAQYGLQVMWSMIPICFLLIVVQEMCARMGVVTGKGLSDLIRERFGVKFTFYLMIVMFLTNLGNTVSNFAGIAAALEIFNVSRFVTVPLIIMFLLWLVVKGNYVTVEKIFLTGCVFYISYVIAGFLVDPEWTDVIGSLTKPTIRWETDYLVMLVGLVGTTIAPWMLFYLQSSVVDKGLGLKDLKPARLDVIIGSVVVTIVAFFIILVCAATLHKAGVRIETAEEAAMALRPLAGPYCTLLFAFGLLNASLLASSILPISTSYTLCEAFGWESSLDAKFSQAPQFYGLYCFMVILSGLVILAPNLPLIAIMFWSQVLNGVVLPAILIFMILLTNDRSLMKSHKNGLFLNIVSWIAVVILIGLSGVMICFSLAGK